jgi:hypothetical protein
MRLPNFQCVSTCTRMCSCKVGVTDMVGGLLGLGNHPNSSLCMVFAVPELVPWGGGGALVVSVGTPEVCLVHCACTGQSTMAVAACFGGPVLNLLVGSGASVVIQTLKQVRLRSPFLQLLFPKGCV